MRGAAVAFAVWYTFGVTSPGTGHLCIISNMRPAAVQSVLPKTAAKTAEAAPSIMKTVGYHGYAIKVPSSWPVYRLDKDPDQCVRYDVNAVYLGAPGSSQDCPPHLVGRTDTLSIGGPIAPGESSVLVRTGLRAAVGHEQGSAGAILENAQLHEIAVSMPGSAPAITATYGTDPSRILHLLTGLHLVTQQTASGTASSAGIAGSQERTPPPGVPPDWPTPTPTAASTATQAPTPAPSSSPSWSSWSPTGWLTGFDTCTAPSLQAIKAWRAKYAVTAIYIGGQEMACDYGNLSKSWVQSAEGMGWSLMPTYVGPQASCNGFSDKIVPNRAAAEGRQSATQAVADAASLGFGKGTPIYYDMEAYKESKASCAAGVLTFLDAWDRQLQASGYVSGVYASAASGVADLQTTARVAGHPLAKPEAIWFALWDNAFNVTGSPYITAAVWPTLARSKQYAGPHVVKVGKYFLDIDSDLVDGPVARGVRSATRSNNGASASAASMLPATGTMAADSGR